MSSESKWRETTVSGCKGPSIYGRNLGTFAQCSDGLPRQEDPHGVRHEAQRWNEWKTPLSVQADDEPLGRSVWRCCQSWKS